MSQLSRVALDAQYTSEITTIIQALQAQGYDIVLHWNADAIKTWQMHST